MWYPGAVSRPVPSHGGAMSAHLGLVLHVQEGDNSPYGGFANPKNEKSSTWWISKSGVTEQYVDSDLVAWAQIAGNYTYNSVETEGFTTEALTDAQMEALARLYSWGHGVYGWPVLLADVPGQRGFGWHGMGGNSWGHPLCPGDRRKAQRIEVLAHVSTLIDGQPPVPATEITTTDMGDVTVQRIDFNNVQLDEGGNGWEWCDAPHEKIVAIKQQGSYPPVDGYWPIARFGSQPRAQDGHQSVIEIQGGNPKQVINFSVWVTP